jgi:hypothetical protein
VTAVCPERAGDIAMLAVGGLDDVQARALQHHLGRCPGCAASLAQMAQTVALLDLADPDHVDTPSSEPDGLDDRVLAALDALAAAEGPAVGDLQAEGDVQALGEVRSIREAPVAREAPPTREARGARGSRGQWWLVAASIVLLLSVFGWALLLRDRGADSGGATIALAPVSERAGDLEVTAELTAKAWGTAVDLVVTGAQPDVVYRVWLADHDGQRVPAGTFRGVDRRLQVSVASALARPDAAQIGLSTSDADPLVTAEVAEAAVDDSAAAESVALDLR